MVVPLNRAWDLPQGEGSLGRAVFDASPDASAVLDADGVIVFVNDAWRRHSADNGGSEAATGPGVSYLDVCLRADAAGCADAGGIAQDLRNVLSEVQELAEIEYACPTPAGHHWFLLRISRLRGPHCGALVSHVNITRRKMAEDELAHAASHDPLSGLANRTLLEVDLAKALSAHGHRSAEPDVGVLFIDLNDFKAINDTLGHSAGDQVLVTVGDRLTAMVRPGDTIARLGGDEFVVVAPRINRRGLTTLATRITNALSMPHNLSGRGTVVTGTVGTHLAGPNETAAAAIAEADGAMYAKKHHRSPEPSSAERWFA